MSGLARPPGLQYAPCVPTVRRRLHCPVCRRPFYVAFESNQTLLDAVEVQCPRECAGTVRSNLPAVFQVEPAE